ncbi:IclR family transcriptional regulator [Microbacterium sp. 179-I 3D3 NHS]|uniref:IclR family transcriptional regulator n=1 Tax=unclassified Microbacterium TaxID=2609290 RepID=UPI00399F05C2
MGAATGSIQSVGKAVGILRLLGRGQAMRVTDVAKEAGLGVSTASRLLATLEAEGLVERDPVSGFYRLGPDMITFGGVAVNQQPLFRGARQVLQNLAASSRLGVNLAVRSGATVMYLANFEGAEAPRNHSIVGRHDPMHATSAGKCLLLGVAVAEWPELLGELTVFTPATITDLGVLEEQVTEIARTGYAKDQDEFALGRASVAVPIRGVDGSVLGAISIAGPTTAVRLDEREADLAATAIEVADRIGANLGYTGNV